MFTRVARIEPANNVTEQTRRLAVIWQEVSFGDHSERCYQFLERMLTTAQTLRPQNHQVLPYRRPGVAGHRADRRRRR